MPESSALTAVLGIHQLRLNVRLGCTPGERALIQPIDVDVLFRFATPPKGTQSDQLEDTVCYAQLSTILRETLEGQEFQLIEHMAYLAYTNLKNKSKGNEQIAIRIHKLKPPVANLNGGTSFVYGDWTPSAWN